MMMQIRVGNFDVFYHGVVIGNENEHIDFLIAEEVGFIIRVIFKNDFTDKSARIHAEGFQKAGAQLTFYNFDSSLVMGNINPLNIGVLNGRELFLNYRVTSLEKGGKTFQFTWLLGKEVTNG